MTTEEMKTLVKQHLKLIDDTHDLLISDIIQGALNFCNLDELPLELEPYIRKKVKNIMDYEAQNGSDAVFDVKSVKEGDTSITYNVDEKTSKETIYGLSDEDMRVLRAFRRLRI